MADTNYTVYSGFYDSVNEDRLYSADDMNQPYKNIMSEGIFSSNDDFGASGSSGTITVKAGNALLGGRWVDADSVSITIPENETSYLRRDSVILQVNNKTDVREARIVYRTTTAGTSTYPALITDDDDIAEFRLANVLIMASGHAISSLTDKRGSTDCPYATILVGDAQLIATVEDVLEDHPEWTTTVQDESISLAKLDSDLAADIAEIADLKSDLETLEDTVSNLSSVPTSVRQAIYTLLDASAYAETGLTDEIAVVQAWAEEVTSLSISPTTLSLSNNTPQTLTATVVPSSSTVSWESSDTSVATVSGGVVTGVTNGSCTVTASSGDKTATCAVTVSGFATLESISAVYTQSGTVYDNDSLDSLKTDLVVTATYDDTSTATVPSTDYTLSGTLTTGTSTITVSYGGKTTTFTVTVTHYDSSLYNWDFTQSLTDSKQGVTVTLPASGATQSSNGLTITSLSSPITCATVSTTTLGQFTVEWDITTFGWTGGTGNKSLAYVSRASSQLQGVMYRGSVPSWAVRDFGGTYYNFTDFSDATMFNGKTLKLQVDQTISNTWKLYCDNVLIGSQSVGAYSGSILIGFRDTGVFTGLRIYEGLV